MARLARTEPRLDAWQAQALACMAAFRQMASSLTHSTFMLNYITRLLSGKGAQAAMSVSFSSYDDRFSEKDEGDLALGSLVGIRYWSVGYGPFHDDLGQPAIELRGARGRWLPGENTAECLSGMRHPPEMVPVRQGCGCGFWAYWAEDPAKGTSYVQSPDVAGMVEGWGRYRAGTRGFRCAKAKLLAVCVQPGQMGEPWRVACEQALAVVYGVPVYSSVATMMKAFPPSRSPVPEPRPDLRYHHGGLVSGAGYTSGWNPAHTLVTCPCGIRYGLAPGSGLACRCGMTWYWDGLTAPVMTRGPAPADVLKALEQKKAP